MVSTPLASNHDEMPVGISRQNSANVGIEPDSLDPDINNENNGLGGGGGSEPEPRSESSNAATTSEGANAASTSSQPAPASTSSNQNVKNGGVSKKPRSRHRQKRHTHSDKRYHSEVRILGFFYDKEIFPAVCTVVKSKGKISQNFVAFSEYMNFSRKNFPVVKKA